jgi:hypothetical protein
MMQERTKITFSTYDIKLDRVKPKKPEKVEECKICRLQQCVTKIHMVGWWLYSVYNDDKCVTEKQKHCFSQEQSE